MDLITNSSTQAITKIANYTNKLNQETKQTLEDLKTQYETIQNISGLNKSNSNIKTTNTSNFLNEAGFIIEKLNSISIDISSILSPEINQELWNKYNAGHKSVFSRYLSKTLDKRQINSLHELIHTNSEFAQYVKSFIKEFNNIIAKASTTDKSEILVETLTSTDIGKIYMLLREIVQ